MQTRRAFLALFATAPAARLHAAAAAPIRIAWISSGGASARLVAGARFGGEEARATAALLGRTFELTIVDAEEAAAAAREAARARKSGALPIAGGLPPRMAAAAMAASAPLLAILPRDVAPTGVESAWRIRPDPATVARTLAGAKLPENERKTARVVAWHPSLRRFGAGELNERFTKRTGTAMDEDAWLGWVAVKLAFESMLRGRAPGESRIDGHKGVLLRFDESRSLQQPLYVVVQRRGREIVADA
jgi:hypothetical protein